MKPICPPKHWLASLKPCWGQNFFKRFNLSRLPSLYLKPLLLNCQNYEILKKLQIDLHSLIIILKDFSPAVGSLYAFHFFLIIGSDQIIPTAKEKERSPLTLTPWGKGQDRPHPWLRASTRVGHLCNKVEVGIILLSHWFIEGMYWRLKLQTWIISHLGNLSTRRVHKTIDFTVYPSVILLLMNKCIVWIKLSWHLICSVMDMSSSIPSQQSLFSIMDAAA